MKAKKKPLDVKKPADLGVDVAPRLKVLKTVEPPARKAGVKVAIASRAGGQAEVRGGGDLHGDASHCRARHDALNALTAKAHDCRQAQLGAEVHVLVAGSGCKPVAEAAAKLDGVAKVIARRRARSIAQQLAEEVAALVVPTDGELRRRRGRGHGARPRTSCRGSPPAST